MTNNPILTNKQSDYPVVARYTNKQSVKQDGNLDLQLSYDHNIVGVHSFRFAKGDVGICIGDYDDNIGGFKLFAFEVVDVASTQKLDTWSKRGGKVWKYNYKIKKSSSIVTLTLDTFQKTTGIPYKGNGHVFNGDRTHKYKKGGNPKYTPLAEARVSIYESLIRKNDRKPLVF